MKVPIFEAQTEWIEPEEYPDLRSYDEIAIDLETRDPELKTRGSGSVIGLGEVVGIAVAVPGKKFYFPIAHGSGPNMDKVRTLEWFKDILLSDATKIFHNAMYDVCWIRKLGLKINGLIVDTMIAASLIDENRFRYDLNTLSWDYLGFGKSEAALNEAAKSRGLDPKADLWQLPAMEVGSYAEKDAELTLELWQIFKKEIVYQDVESIFNLETDLFPCLVDMRFLGVKVDVEHAHKLKQDLEYQENLLLRQIKKESNIDVQIWAARSIATVFDKLKLPYERTKKTQAPSFTKNFLQEHPHPIVKQIAKAREINKAHTTFIDTIIKYEHNGRIHAEINQIRSDAGGTVTGRFSYNNPNLQQLPARNKELGPMIRSLFLPEEGCTWGCFDYSQQEPRLVVHYASLHKFPTVYDVVDAYENDSSTDFHQTVADLAKIPRDQAKTINLGLFYGMGKAKLQAELGVSKEKAAELFDQYHAKVPFVKQLMNSASNRAQERGQIRTLLGRLCRFHLWEPNQFGMHKAMSHEDALREHGPGIRRAFTYKALNKLIQGSAADMTKKAMLELYKEGILAHIQIHDELDLSVESDAQAKKIIEIMENAVSLEVPNKVDYESGKTWGDIYDKD
jgi:DNA polymerase I-like protein with 3'-5' exonuclease and polymerase domains|tara:strand:+ start:4262 stop:6124 length:1863 start_codon:yes stop_codon:yes gene_type:complete